MKLRSTAAGAVGAGLMFFLDPDRGRRRRAMMREKSGRMIRDARKSAGSASRDLQNRTNGMVAGMRAAFSHEEVDDDRLVERVRARLGKVTAHPRSISVTASNGVVTIGGPILAAEADAVRAAVRSTRSVQRLDDRLEIHEVADIPQLQGGRARALRRTRPEPGRSSPVRLLVGAAGGVLALLGVRGKGAMRIAAGSIGIGTVIGAVVAGHSMSRRDGEDHADEKELDGNAGMAVSETSFDSVLHSNGHDAQLESLDRLSRD